MSKSSPSDRDIKRLFAESRNSCAFPKCQCPIINEGSVVGEICHISARNERGARFDSKLSDDQRHGYDNLLLLCSVHHKVVDDDEVSYTVERLRKLKTDHLKAADESTNETPVDIGAIELLKNSYISNNQKGGVSAHTINAQNIQVFGANERLANHPEAVAAFWKAIQFIESETSDLTYLHAILTSDEISNLVVGKLNNADLSRIVSKYSKIDAFNPVVSDESVMTARLKEPFVQKELVTIFNSIIALFGRLAVLVSVSKSKSHYQDWREDNLMRHNLREVCTQEQFQTAASLQVGGINFLYEILKNKFLEHARD